jgi:hypothetical protein
LARARQQSQPRHSNPKAGLAKAGNPKGLSALSPLIPVIVNAICAGGVRKKYNSKFSESQRLFSENFRTINLSLGIIAGAAGIFLHYPVDFLLGIGIFTHMNTFIVTIYTPMIRSVRTNRAVVSAETAEAAVLLVKNYYGTGATGWSKEATFKAEQLPANSVKFVV